MKSVAWRALAAAACCAAAAALLLAVLQPEAVQPDGRHLAVFRQDRSVRLDSNNVVDLLASAEFGQKIKRVHWSGSVLSVDFAVRDDDAAAEAVFSDLKELILQAFGHTTNVQRLLVRFEENEAGSAAGRGRLLLAADVRRSDPWIAEQWTGLKDADLGRDAVWRKRLRLTATSRWNERFGRAAPES
ncbi:MAG: hypothetical protein C6W59_02345 [Paenibacillaceae bacterium]|jgi:hypothetical protein|nr:MAG: hypothetical protein C6W59_02345 [Paenibacillaceae bacterium]